MRTSESRSEIVKTPFLKEPRAQHRLLRPAFDGQKGERTDPGTRERQQLLPGAPRIRLPSPGEGEEERYEPGGHETASGEVER